MSGMTFQTRRRVEFRDTDAAGIVHFSVFFNYMEAAEHEFLRHLGLSVVTRSGPVVISWPRVSARCDYRQSIRFEEIVDIDVSVRQLGNKSITWGFHFHRDGVAIAAGEVTAVCCEIRHAAPDEPIRPVSIEIPQEFRNKLQPYLATGD